MNRSEDGKKIFFIIRLPDQPLVLEKTKAVVIGRADINDLVIPENRVSRRHAKIQWLDENNSFAIKDLQSLNGTYINGKKLSPNQFSVLKDWDKIRIASTVYTFREDFSSNLDQEFNEINLDELEESTQFMSNKEQDSTENQPAFSGSLSSLCPIELFQMIQASNNTGILKISTSEKKGEFIILEGQIIKASFGKRTGEEAVFNFFKYNYGTFAFYPRKDVSKTRDIQASTNSLILQGCQLLDETDSNQP